MPFALPCSAAFLPLLGGLALAVGWQEPQPCASHRACRWPRTYHGPSLTARFICTLLQSQADPNYKLIAAAYPYMARRLLTDPAPELR